ESARRQKLALIGAVNKVDTADETQIENAIGEVATLLGCEAHAVLRVSGKTGQGVLELLGRVISDVPAPRSRLPDESRCSRALIFDSLYDDHKGIIAFVRVVEGTYATGARLRLMATNTLLAAKEVGYFAPKLTRAASLETGEIGYIATGMKDPDALRIGDTVTADANGACVPLPGYAEPKPVVFVSLYPEDTARYENLKSALSQLRLTDASLAFEPEANEVLGRGFKGGFLGQLHFEITVSRLEREFGLATITSFPSVAYRIVNQEGTWETITNPRDFPEDGREVEEPVAATEILVPNRYLGAVLQLKEKFRFSGITVATLGSDKSNVSAHLPLADLVSDLNDRLKSISEGFASLSYEVTGWQSADVVKMDTLVAGQVVPGLTRIVPRADAGREARATVEKLKKLLPQQQFTQAIQAVVAGQVIARETIAAARKDVTGYLYGGDRSRKMKLWKKQQRGKKRLKERGEQQRVKVPVSVFKELLKR
ncbi:MAG: elongation factor 4, partial [Candidatus Colwellbacteria bacterium]|nr:elongation factor 4 [Candidatus Colwellbacteria bacterium]